MPRAPSSVAAAAVRWCSAALATAYGRVGGHGPQPLDGPDDHDDAARTEAGGGPVEQGRRGAQAGAVEGVPGGGVEVVPLDVSLREGVEHDDVGRAHRGGAAVEQVVARGIQCGGVGDVEVGVQGGGPATGGLDVGDRGGGTVGVAPVVHADVVSVLRQHQRDDPAQSAAGPGDERGHRIRPTGSSRVRAAISAA